ncbi:uncharacterized protein LOC122568413 [Bombus pyrosoma]|uniref:uncharacterized protein LOC122568413 n=1 Tax=Bombus pyrosoma TaxID=396416 RepID=UPI001CB9D073|nr:uncharacterized protein LOC122568413 [Bombus pyrosoma]
METVRSCGCKRIRSCVHFLNPWEIGYNRRTRALLKKNTLGRFTHSGRRRKQNVDPKCNGSKKRKLRLASFDGFSKSTQFVQF